MINDGGTGIAEATLKVLDGLELHGQINTDEATLLQQVGSAIRRGHPQIRPDAVKPDRVCLVGGGPSLVDTEDELRQLLYEGALLVTVNGAYQWCLERNYRPQTQIVMDARASNAKFVQPAIPRCRYVLASQCHPDTWDAVEGRDNVWIFHASAGVEDTLKTLLDTYYGGEWFGVTGGTTVATRAISVLRTLGYLRFDLFGIDSCVMGGQHHAYAQPENDRDRRVQVTVHPSGHPEHARVFLCSPWHLKQAEDFAQMVRINGHQFLLNVHGDGLLAYMLRSSADVVMTTERA